MLESDLQLFPVIHTEESRLCGRQTLLECRGHVSRPGLRGVRATSKRRAGPATARPAGPTRTVGSEASDGADLERSAKDATEGYFHSLE